MTKTKTPSHDRTPENTPIPGGGSWQWDATAGQWISLDPIASTEGQPMEPVFADTLPQDKE